MRLRRAKMAPTADSVGLTTKKTMSELRVIELRSELEKRGLDKTGVKAALIERLSHALRDEGEDVDTFEFEVPAEAASPVKPATPVSGAKKPVTKRVNKKLAQDEETQSNEDAHEGGESEEEEEAEIETVDEEEEEEADCGEEKVNNGEAEPKEDEKEAAGDDDESKEEKKNAKEDEDGGQEAEQALIVHADDNHDLDADIEEDEAATAKEGAEGETAKPSGATKTAAAKKAEAAKKEAGEGAKAEPKKAAAKTKAAGGKAVKATAKAAAADKEPIRNLWVTGLANTTRAADLKALFGKHGKVTSAKIVTNAKTPGARCYGFMTMSTAEEATKCIQHLHRTELHGKMISVERTKHEPGGALRKSEAKTAAAAGTTAATAKSAAAKEGKETTPKAKAATKAKAKEAAEKKAAAKDGDADKAEDEEAAEEAVEEKEEAEEEEGDEEGKGKDRKHRDDKERRRSRSRSRERFGRGRFFRSPFIRGFRSIRGFRRPFIRRPFFRGPFRGRMGTDFRDREPFRRNMDEAASFRQRELERRQREEAFRIERERERLRVEREKLERERLELLRLEREKQRLERERIQREREELRQRKMGRAAEFGEGPGLMRRPIKRPYDEEPGGGVMVGGPPRMEAGGDAFWRDRKRPHLGPGRDYDRGTDRDDRRFDRPGDFGGDREFRRVPRDRVPRESPPVRRMDPRFPSKEEYDFYFL